MEKIAVRPIETWWGSFCLLLREKNIHTIFYSSCRGFYLTYDEWPGRAWLSYSRTLWQENLLLTGLCGLWGFTASEECVRELCVLSICGTNTPTYKQTHTHTQWWISNKTGISCPHTRTRTNRCDFFVTLREIYSDNQPSADSINNA